MNFSFVLDWKFVLAIGAAVGITTLALKADSNSAEKVLTNLVDTTKELDD